MSDYDVKMNFYDSVKIEAMSAEDAAIARVKKHMQSLNSTNHVVDVDGEKYGVTVVVSIN